LLKQKSEAFKCFKKFHKSVTTLHSRPIKSITTNGGGKFNSLEFKQFLESYGITSNITAPYTKRGNCTTTEKAGTLLKQANLPLRLWGHAVETAVFLENITPTKKNNWVSAYELWFSCPFNKSCLCSFGCRAFVNLPKSKRESKFSKTERKGIMIGYQLGMHNWRILREDESVELSHDVTLDKTLYPGISNLNPAGLQSPPRSFWRNSPQRRNLILMIRLVSLHAAASLMTWIWLSNSSLFILLLCQWIVPLSMTLVSVKLTV
jgi:hypothetical protein